MQVIKYGHPTLRKVAEEIDVDEIDQDFVEDMIETMYKEDGVGLAAPQVNVSKRLLVATDLENLYVMINPKIVAMSESVETDIEGCLSLPDLQAEVARSKKIIVRAFDRDGKPYELKAQGLLARVLQHEIDHLNGVLFIDRADLDTLVWLVKKDDETVEKVKTDLSFVRETFKKYFNENEVLVYDKG